MKILRYRRREPLLGRFFTPKYFLLRAMMLAVLFFLAHVAGLQEYTTFLSGTPDSSGASLETSAFWGTGYLVLYLGIVVAVPILLLAATLLWIAGRLMQRRTMEKQVLLTPVEALGKSIDAA